MNLKALKRFVAFNEPVNLCFSRFSVAASQVHSSSAALIGFRSSSDECKENKYLDRHKITSKFFFKQIFSKVIS